MNNKKKVLVVSGAAALLLFGVPAFAATTRPHTIQIIARSHRLSQAAFGTVQSINGATITLSHKAKDGIQNVTVTTNSTTVYKQKGTITTASSVAVGDRIVAMGIKDEEGNITNATSVHIFSK